MEVVILSAGIGSRLGNPFPKPLTPLQDGQRILDKQVAAYSSAFGKDKITLVVGFKKNLIMESFPDLKFVYNSIFDQTNTSKSLLTALSKVTDEGVLWSNGDVVFDPKLLVVLQPYIDKDVSFVSVNTSKVSDEEVKYTLENGYINELSKEVKNGLGEAVGINYISSKDLAVFKNYLDACDAQDYFEKAIELSIQNENIKVEAVDISQFNCIEVDFQEDLDFANETFFAKA